MVRARFPAVGVGGWDKQGQEAEIFHAITDFGWWHIMTVCDSQMILSLAPQRREDFLSTLLGSVPGPEN